ncbi:DUF4815 domain-containing protein [Rhizobium halophytocola]|uniref:DUF4815 domain-containing protein n=1 Tax=Rhizobium halophytocola TaxID=735519 RepID=A0ABS4E2E9_9HYPH|nr:DUF4815 domain-containing protein [Rhizobium halophytocola]MBP1852115.1 hypothetical protein [Rhizobium halophytocola]
MSTNVFDPDLHPEFVNVRDRTADRPDVDRVYFAEGAVAQAADLNDALSTQERKRKQIGDLIAKDGDRLAGGDIIVSAGAGRVFISDGTLYIKGAPRTVDARTLNDVAMAGDVELGVWLTEVPVTAADDDIYYGLVPGTESYGEEGAIRVVVSLKWGTEFDEAEGDFYRYALLRDGVVISQAAPPSLTGVQKQIGVYDYDAHGNYIVRGCEVKALNLNGTKRVFSIAAGVCNVLGAKINREADIRYEVEEEPDLATVDLEPHTFSVAGTTTIFPRHTPIAVIATVTITKEKTVTINKGTGGGADLLPDESVTTIVSVSQGATVYGAPADYTRQGDSISWAPGGAEPATGSSYTVKYRYFETVEPGGFTDTSITVSGGVQGSDMFVSYSYKLPRHDRILVDGEGGFIYQKGEPSPEHPSPPREPADALALCVVKNTWVGRPVVDNDGTRALDFKRLNYLENRLAQTIDMVLLERLKSDANSRAPGPTLGIFTDPFWDDRYRDLGEPQDAAAFDGSLQLAIDPTIHSVRLPSIGMLDYSDTVVVSQDLSTSCELINPYANYSPAGPTLKITPTEDYWTESDTQTLSPITQVFGTGNQTRIRSSTTSQTVSSEQLAFLRQITVAYTVEGLGPGEKLQTLLFDGISVRPAAAPVANGEGKVTGTFVIPANVAAGLKKVDAVGAAGLGTSAAFRGQGRLETTTLQTTTVLERFSTMPDRSWRRQSDVGEGANPDPQAQSFTVNQGRFITAFAAKFCKIGTRSIPVDVDLVTMENGVPTTTVLATARLNMVGVIANTWTKIAFDFPCYVPKDTFVAFVIKTSDANHSIAAATLGDFDKANQKWVAAQPYITGDRFDGSNGVSWLVHPDSDLTFRGYAAKFNPTQKIIQVGTFSAEDLTDLLVRADMILPESDCSVIFKVQLGPKTYSVQADQTLELTAKYSGTVKVSAVLIGSERASPVLSRDIAVIFGTLRSSGRYVGLPFTMGDPARIDIMFSGYLPPGAGVAVAADAKDDAWTAATLVNAVPIDDGFTEYTYRIEEHTASQGGRVRLDLTGTPAGRPAIADLRTFSF